MTESNIVFYAAPSKEVMRITANGITVSPDVTLDEAAEAVIEALDCHIKSLLCVQESAEAAYLYTNVQSGDVVASTDPDWADDDRQMWHKEPLFKRG